MSIQQVKLVTIIGPLSRFDRAVSMICQSSDFHPENALDILVGIKGLHSFSVFNPYEGHLSAAVDFLSFAGIEPAYVSFEGNQLDVDGICEYFEGVRRELSQLRQRKDQLLTLISDDEKILNQLRPIRNVDVVLDYLFNMEFTKFRFGRLPRESYERYKLFIEETKNILFFPSTIEDDYVWGMYFNPIIYSTNIDSLFASLHFERIRISDRAHGTPREAIDFLTGEIEKTRAAIAGIEARMLECVAVHKEALLSGYSKIKYMFETFDMHKYAAHSDENFYMIGWVPSARVQDFVAQFDSDPVMNYVIDDTLSHPSIKPPTKLKNFGLFRPFEQFVRLYGLPSYNEIDPTPFVALTYLILFGIMFGDVGQGALLVLVGLYMTKKLGMSLGGVVSRCGISSMLFGCVYGSVFGYEDLLPGFKVMHSTENTNLMLLFAIGLGIGLILTVMTLNIINGIRQKDFGKVLFDVNGAAGLVFYIAVILMVLELFGFGTSVMSTAYILLFVVAPLLIMFLRHPLSKLLARKPDWIPKNKGEFILENFFEMFEILLSYVTNTISFIRVGAFALNHAGMMMVVFILAKTAGGSNNMLVVVLGNLLVVALEGLIVGIQVLRLEYYELFSRFFEGQGREFIPIQINYTKKSS